MTAADRPIRVIQWTTGNIGRRSLHAIIGRDDMELVGVYAHGADKVGVDAAELAGRPEPTGVRATNSIDDLIALKPDACCYNPLWPNIDELVALLEAGVNVCSTAAWITGGKQTQEDLDRIRKACETGNSTIFGSGAHPGMTNMVGMVLSGSCERVDEIRSPSRWTARPTNRQAPRAPWASVRIRTPLDWPRACAARARCSPNPRR